MTSWRKGAIWQPQGQDRRGGDFKSSKYPSHNRSQAQRCGCKAGERGGEGGAAAEDSLSSASEDDDNSEESEESEESEDGEGETGAGMCPHSCSNVWAWQQRGPWRLVHEVC